MQAIGDEKGIRQAKEKIRQKQAKMREFINDTGRTRRYDREQVTSLSKQDTLNHHQQMVEKAREKIRNKISKGKISTKINPEKQARHILGDPAYEAYKEKLSKKGVYGPSYLTISQGEAQKLVQKYAGTGEIRVSKNFKFENKERILHNDKKSAIMLITMEIISLLVILKSVIQKREYTFFQRKGDVDDTR